LPKLSGRNAKKLLETAETSNIYVPAFIILLVTRGKFLKFCDTPNIEADPSLGFT
jgi:hypothetical protein